MAWLLRRRAHMYTQLRLRVWLVEPHVDTDEVEAGLPADAETVEEATPRERIEAGDRPDALLVDAEALERLDGQRYALDGVLRTVVVTDRDADDLPAAYLDRPSIRVLRRPVDAASLDRALLWLSGADDDGWAAAASR
jgi:hypothetical protein